jgi:hypothetical protein
MSIQKIYANGLSGSITIPATESIAVRSLGGPVQVYRLTGYPNVPDTKSLLGTVADGAETVFGAYSSGATIQLEASEGGAKYAVGVGPKVGAPSFVKEQATPGALNATGTLTAALISGGIVTSTSGAGVTATLDTGAIIDAALDLAIGEAFDWTVINTGGNTFTVTASTGHTIVGVAAVLTVTSVQFRTRKTAADTFVTYRIS